MLDAAYSFVESDENLQDRQIYLTMTGTNPGMMSPVSDTITFVSGSDNTKQSFGTEQYTYNTWNVDQGGKIEFEFKGKVNGISAEWAEKQERLDALNRAVERLDPEERALVTLFYYEDRSVGECAAITELSEGNVKVRLHRIRKKLYILVNDEMNGKE